MIIQDICPNCFQKGTYQNNSCSRCGFRGIKARETGALPLGLMLKERYCIGRVLGEGMIGFTYLVYDRQEKRYCVAKEFFPKGWTVRAEDGITVQLLGQDKVPKYAHGAEVFANEAKMLNAMIDEPAVVDVTDYFMENDTAYMVMEYVPGVTLAEYISQQQAPLSWQQAGEIVKQVAGPVGQLHEFGLVHRNINPEIFMYLPDGTVKILDIGATRQYMLSENNSFAEELKPGFASEEQYSTTAEQGAWTDVYAMAATYYYLVTGKNPIRVQDRGEPDRLRTIHQMKPEISEEISQIVVQAMHPDPVRRIRSMAEFIEKLEQAENVKPPMPYILLKAEGKSRMWRIEADRKIHLGRSAEDCEISIQGNDISRIHCEISYDSSKRVFLVTDLSANGTFTESGLIGRERTASISAGEKIYLATRQFELLLDTK